MWLHHEVKCLKISIKLAMIYHVGAYIGCMTCTACTLCVCVLHTVFLLQSLVSLGSTGCCVNELFYISHSLGYVNWDCMHIYVSVCICSGFFCSFICNVTQGSALKFLCGGLNWCDGCSIRNFVHSISVFISNIVSRKCLCCKKRRGKESASHWTT